MRHATATAAIRAVAALAPSGGRFDGVRRRARRRRRRWTPVGFLAVASDDGFSGHGGSRHRRCSVLIEMEALSEATVHAAVLVVAAEDSHGNSRRPRELFVAAVVLVPMALGGGNGGSGGSFRRKVHFVIGRQP